MQVSVFSDLHCHNYKQHDKEGSRLTNCLKFLVMLFKFNAKRNIKVTLFGGDLYDSEGELPTIVVTEVIETLTLLFEKFPNQMIVAITGNHDQATKNLWSKKAVSALTHLAKVFPKNFYLIDDDCVMVGNTQVHGIPYYEFPEDFYTALESRASNVGNCPAVLLMHQTPSGLYDPSIPVDVDINNPLFDAFDLILDGHIHQRQDISDKYTVIGSPLHRDLGDEGDEKGFLVLDIDTLDNKYEFISTRGKFPEFVRAKSEDFANYEGQYIVRIPDIDTSERTKEAKVAEFNTSLKATDLIKNYWAEAGQGDEKLLQTGLSLL